MIKLGEKGGGIAPGTGGETWVDAQVTGYEDGDHLTQAEYDTLATKDPATLYVVTS